jgi:glycosyltransferase involved in cell wall biosynthesis
MTPLRIALLGYRSHPHVGGQGVYLRYLSRALAALGHRVEVISGQPYPQLDANIPLIKLPSLDLYQYTNPAMGLRWRDLNSLTNILEYLKTLSGQFAEPYCFGRRLVAWMKKNPTRYDIVHDNQSLCFGLLHLQKQGIPVVATVHHPISKDAAIAVAAAKTPLQKWGAKRWYSFIHMQASVVRQLRYVTCVSQRSQADIEQFFLRPASATRVIYNGIDTQVFKPHPEIKRIPGRLITAASSDQPIKGLGYLLTAFHAVKKLCPEAQLVIIGSLDPQGPNAQLLKSLQLEADVSFKTGLDHAQVALEYCRSELAITPSLYEGFGMPAGEAMATATPVISSDGGALPEVVGDAGLLFPAGDSAALTAAIVQLLQNPEMAAELGQKGHARVQALFSWNAVAQDMVALYQQAMSPHAHAHH